MNTENKVGSRRQGAQRSDNVDGSFGSRAVRYEEILSKHGIRIRDQNLFSAGDVLRTVSRYEVDRDFYRTSAQAEMMINQMIGSLDCDNPNIDKVEVLLQAKCELDRSLLSSQCIEFMKIALLLCLLLAAFAVAFKIKF